MHVEKSTKLRGHLGERVDPKRKDEMIGGGEGRDTERQEAKKPRSQRMLLSSDIFINPGSIREETDRDAQRVW